MSMRMSRADKQAATRRALLDAAAELFVERGLQGASVEAISERAGFTRGAFYSNFSSKEQLFSELLQDRVYRGYRGMIDQRLASDAPRPTARETGAALARFQDLPDRRWLLRLWLELLAQASRDDEMRELAREFWRTNRELTATVVEQGRGPRGLSPLAAATAVIALDIGLAIQHHVDPEAVPLDLYPEIFGALFD